MIQDAQYTEGGNIRVVIDDVVYSVPDDPANRHRQMIAEWEAEGNTIAPYVSPPQESQASLDARAYLAATDWYVIRAVDSGVPVPPDIQAARAEARLKVEHV